MKIKDDLKKSFIKEAEVTALEIALTNPAILLTQEIIAKRARLQAESEFDDFMNKVKKGFTYLKEQLDHLPSDIKINVNETMAQLEKKFLKHKRDRTLSEAIKNYWGISDLQRQNLYSVATSLLENKQKDEAAEVFFVLTLLFPQIAEFWLGLGVIERERQNYETALLFFLEAHELNPGLSHPYAAAAECYLALGDRDRARETCHQFFKMGLPCDSDLAKKIELIQSQI